MADEFEVNGHMYRAGKMPLMEKFHVGRRLAPVLSDLMKGAAPAGAEAASSTDGAVTMMSAVAEAVSKLPQADADYIIDQCMSVVHVKDKEHWFKVWRSGRSSYDFIDLPDLLQIVMGVLQENLGAFFPANPSPSTDTAETSPTSSLSLSQTV